MKVDEYLLVKARIKRELENLKDLEQELASLQLYPKIKTDSVKGFSLYDSAACRLIGSILHDYYGAIENIFKCIAKI